MENCCSRGSYLEKKERKESEQKFADLATMNPEANEKKCWNVSNH